jgi:hypothetical protein
MTLILRGHLGAGTDPPSQVAIDLSRFLSPVRVPETGFADRYSELARLQNIRLVWEQAYHLLHDLGRIAAPSLVSAGRPRCPFTLIAPKDTSKVKTPASANHQPAANPEVGITGHSSGPEAGKAGLVLSDAAEESPAYRGAPFRRLAFRCRLKEPVPNRRL